MNFESLKIGFMQYLEEIGELSNKEYKLNDSEISIFMYANEFKDYLEDELNISSSEYSENINDLMDMEIVNGKLINPEEEETEKEENEKNETNEERINEKPSTETTQNHETDNIQNEITQQTNSNQQQNAINPEMIENSLSGNTAILENSNIISNMMNDLMQDNKFKQTLDGNEDGNINEEELAAFFNTIKSFDSNENTISLDDIINATQSIQNGEFKITTPENIAADIEAEEPLTPKGEEAKAARSSNSSGGGSASYDSGSSNQQPKTLATMNESELNTELGKRQTTLDEKKKALDSIYNGTDENIKTLEENEENAFKEYQEKVNEKNPELAKQLGDMKMSIDSKEKEIDENDKAITEKELSISNAKNTVENVKSKVTNLQSVLEGLKNADTSEMDEKQKESINTKISEIESQLAIAKEEQTEAEATVLKEEADLVELNKKKVELKSGEGGLDKLNEELSTLEKSITAEVPGIETYMQAHKTAKQELEAGKQAAITAAKAEIVKAQEAVHEVNNAITENKNKQTAIEYAPDGLTSIVKEALELAFSQLGVYEDKGDNRGTMEKYGGGKGVPWCAAFVSWLYGKGQNGTETPIDFTAAVSGLRDQAQKAGYYSKVGTYTPVPGDIMIQKSNGASHTGIVVGCDGEYVYTIEGNSSNAVRERKYKIGSSSYGKISGWIRMNEWTGGSSNVSGTTYLANTNSEDADKKNRSTL